MKKIISAIATFVIALGVSFMASTPVYAYRTEPCPAGSFQGDTETETLGNVYIAEGTAEEVKTNATKLSSLNVNATTGKVTGAVFASVAQCNMNGNDLKGSDLMSSVSNIATVITSVLGIVAVFVIILGGVQYATSSGDPAKVKKAKDIILYGIIGLMVALLAYGIVNFILSSIWG